MTERHRHEWSEDADGSATCTIDGCHLWLPSEAPNGGKYHRSEYMTELQKEWLRTSYASPACGDLHRCGRMVQCALNKGHAGKHQGEPDGGGRYLYEWAQDDDYGPYARHEAPRPKLTHQRPRRILV